MLSKMPVAGGEFKESSSQSVELQLYKSKLVCHSRGPVPICREAGIQLRHSSRNAKRVFVEQSGKTGFRNTVRNGHITEKCVLFVILILSI